MLDGKLQLYFMEAWIYIEKLWVGKKSGCGGVFVEKNLCKHEKCTMFMRLLSGSRIQEQIFKGQFGFYVWSHERLNCPCFIPVQ